MKVEVSEKDVQAVKAYLNYISDLKEKKKTMLNGFLRRHVQDVHFNPFVSEKAVELLKKKNITSKALKEITWNYEKPGDGVDKNIRMYFTDRAQGKKNTKKILHFEHNIPAGQAAEMLLNLGKDLTDADQKIKEILSLCTLCLIAVEEDANLNNEYWEPEEIIKQTGIKVANKQRWTNIRPTNAYKRLKIELMTLDDACKVL